MNKKFFDEWSSDMAYILGFIMADGNVRHKNYSNSKGCALCLNLQLNDIEILDFIKDKIGTNANVCIYKYTGNDGIYREQCSLTITSEYMINRLIFLGVVPQKTGKESFPDMPHIFERDFIRGYFDGDGCIMITTQTCNGKQYPVRMFKITCANKQFLHVCKEKLKYTKNNVRYHGNNCYILETRNKKDILQIRDYLYYNDDIFSLKRKKDKFFLIS